MIVIDCSYALALAFPDEDPPPSADHVMAQPLVAPHIFALEVANAALNSVRRRRYSPEEAESICRTVEELGVEVLPPPSVEYRFHLRMGLAHGLSAYDALYLDAALAGRCALATRDGPMAAAARKAGIEVFS